MRSSVYKQVLRFKEKYPMTIGWRLRENASIVERHLNPDEKVIYAFVAQKNDSFFNIFNSAVIALTNKRILIGRKRVFVGYFLNSITPDMYNDLKISSGLIWGKVYIDTIKEFVTLSNISIDALTEIETEISSYMMEEKKKYARSSEEKD
ncbi:MAG: PH domain-containing protein [Bacilli bacterium]|nr:PH domain-containing protein [Bacilli bacterium]